MLIFQQGVRCLQGSNLIERNNNAIKPSMVRTKKIGYYGYLETGLILVWTHIGITLILIPIWLYLDTIVNYT